VNGKLLKKVPNKPGVYLFKDKSDRVIYVGKAKALKKRMSSYFQKTHADNQKTRMLVGHITSFDFVVTDSESEALMLENNLIKRYKPHYNIDLRDDKSYPYLAISYDDEFPRLYITRELHRKGTLYFGPYAQVANIRKTLDMLRGVFPIRTYARKRPSRSSSHPFLDYHIKWGLTGKIEELDVDEYRKVIDQVKDFLEGKDMSVIKRMEKEMRTAARNTEFEQAARLRDRIDAARYLQEQQKVVSEKRIDRDIVGLVEKEGTVYIRILFVRSGKLIGSRGFVLERDQVDDDVLASFLEGFYAEASQVPKEILLPRAPLRVDVLEQWLSEKRGTRVDVSVPQRGEKKDLVKMAVTNAGYAYEVYRIHNIGGTFDPATVLAGLQEHLELPVLPYRIECFDISTLQGTETVASMVVFENSRSKRSDYRKFRIKRVSGQDDFGSMVEVLKRRLSHLASPIPDARFASKPDLLVVDGGKPQLTAALKAMDDLDIEDVPVIALAKREEEIYVPGKVEPLALSKRDPALNLIRQLRDEAHRFAVGYHRERRGKRMVSSVFDKIPGVGPKRKKALIKHFGTPDIVYKSTVDEIAEAPGISNELANTIYEHLHK
jgi:excinuclease ABC subunit C